MATTEGEKAEKRENSSDGGVGGVVLSQNTSER